MDGSYPLRTIIAEPESPPAPVFVAIPSAAEPRPSQGVLTAAVLVTALVHVGLFAASVGGRAPAQTEAAPPPIEVQLAPAPLPKMPPPPPPEPAQEPPPAASSVPLPEAALPLTRAPAPRPVAAQPAPVVAPPLRTVTAEPVTVPAAPPGRAIPAPAPAVRAEPKPQPAPAPASPPASAAAKSTFEGRVMARLAQVKRYPASSRARREQGVAYVRFTMTGQGRVRSVALDRTSGHSALDREALDTVRRAQPLPKIPDDLPDPLELTVAVEFVLR